MKLLIIDEYSLVKVEILYQIDQRLKEIMLCEERFGGVSVILLGNTLQLKPVRARNIFHEPTSDQWKFGHQLESLWETFLPVKLTSNHRQADESRFADLLKRIARGIKTQEDLDLLRTRVVPENDPSIPEDTFYIFPNRQTIRAVSYTHLTLPTNREV